MSRNNALELLQELNQLSRLGGPPIVERRFLARLHQCLVARLADARGVFLFGGLANVPPLFWVWMVGLNALIGVACAVWFLRLGIEGAILVHAGADLVWHVLTQLG